MLTSINLPIENREMWAYTTNKYQYFGGNVLHKFRSTSCIGVLICFGMVRVASSRRSRNAIETMDGSTVSSPIAFESFLAESRPPPGFTGVRFLLTINVAYGDTKGTA
jgi:hypothetical protein